MISVHSSGNKTGFSSRYSAEEGEGIVIQVQWDPLSGWLIINGCPTS